MAQAEKFADEPIHMDFHCQEVEMHAPASARGRVLAWSFGLTLGGEVLFDADTRRIRCGRGEWWVIRELHPQYWRIPAVSEGGAGNWRVALSAFAPRPHWLPWLQAMASDGLNVFRCSSTKMQRRLLTHFRRAARYSRSTLPYREDLAMHALEAALLTCWLVVQKRSRHADLDPRIEAALRILNAEANKPLKLTQLARRCHLSRSHLAGLFRKQVGTTPLQYQERRRIEAAQRMLRISLDSVRQTALQCGFEDTRYFSTRFKKHTGLTPRDYRKRARMR
ncbi:MAG TPA: helix-turn-helix domain-containing protein [Planctomycetota bacterium]|nr:helix-turn-helix domain-containing protein [Planctomycetota bacterium]